MGQRWKEKKARNLQDRDRQIMKLRKKGMSQGDIARVLGLHPNTVHHSLRRSYDKVLDRHVETVRAQWLMDLQRLDDMLRVLWEQTIEAPGHDDEDGDGPVPIIRAERVARNVEVMLKILERRAKLLGLDAPERVQQISVGLNVQNLTIEELRQELQKVGGMALPPPNPLLLDQSNVLPGEFIPSEPEPSVVVQEAHTDTPEASSVPAPSEAPDVVFEVVSDSQGSEDESSPVTTEKPNWWDVFRQPEDRIG